MSKLNCYNCKKGFSYIIDNKIITTIMNGQIKKRENENWVFDVTYDKR